VGNDQAPATASRSIRLSRDEAWAVIAQTHTGIFTTLRRDGTPISLPVWFVVEDQVIWLSTPLSSKKVTRVRNNPQSSFLVESGRRWAELLAVHMSCVASIVEGDRTAWVDAEKAKKYEADRTERSALPSTTRGYYEADRVAIRLDPSDRVLSWDNSRIGLG
jgi:hypothetical protein